jgi:hypothetical protein
MSKVGAVSIYRVARSRCSAHALKRILTQCMLKAPPNCFHSLPPCDPISEKPYPASRGPPESRCDRLQGFLDKISRSWAGRNPATRLASEEPGIEPLQVSACPFASVERYLASLSISWNVSRVPFLNCFGITVCLILEYHIRPVRRHNSTLSAQMMPDIYTAKRVAGISSSLYSSYDRCARASSS